MLRFVVLAAALVTLPALAGAEEVWRWRDSSGQLHYSNVPGNVPSYAEPLRTKLGRMSGTVRSEPVAPAPRVRPEPEAAAPRARHAIERYDGRCPAFGGPGYILLYNPHELSDQVKQANLLDALHVPWRNRCS
jgi:hypothetical protein